LTVAEATLAALHCLDPYDGRERVLAAAENAKLVKTRKGHLRGANAGKIQFLEATRLRCVAAIPSLVVVIWDLFERTGEFAFSAGEWMYRDFPNAALGQLYGDFVLGQLQGWTSNAKNRLRSDVYRITAGAERTWRKKSPGFVAQTEAGAASVSSPISPSIAPGALRPAHAANPFLRKTPWAPSAGAKASPAAKARQAQTAIAQQPAPATPFQGPVCLSLRDEMLALLDENRFRALEPQGSAAQRILHGAWLQRLARDRMPAWENTPLLLDSRVCELETTGRRGAGSEKKRRHAEREARALAKAAAMAPEERAAFLEKNGLLAQHARAMARQAAEQAAAEDFTRWPAQCEAKKVSLQSKTGQTERDALLAFEESLGLSLGAGDWTPAEIDRQRRKASRLLGVPYSPPPTHYAMIRLPILDAWPAPEADPFRAMFKSLGVYEPKDVAEKRKAAEAEAIESAIAQNKPRPTFDRTKANVRPPAPTQHVALPIHAGHDFDGLPGALNKSAALLPPRADKPGREEWQIALTKTLDQKALTELVGGPKVSKTAILSGDIGQRAFLSTSAGVPGGSPALRATDSEGHPVNLTYILQGWGASIREPIEKLARYQAERQRQGLAARTKRQQKMTTRLRGRIENEIGEALNQLMAAGAPMAFVVEAIAPFNRESGSVLSAAIARVSNQMGIGALREWAERQCPAHGTLFWRENAAYTSQQCAQCLHVAKENRKNGSLFFKCVKCGFFMQADSSASLILAERFRFAIWLRHAEKWLPELGLGRAKISPDMSPPRVLEALEQRSLFLRDPEIWGKALDLGILPKDLEARARQVSGNWATLSPELPYGPRNGRWTPAPVPDGLISGFEQQPFGLAKTRCLEW